MGREECCASRRDMGFKNDGDTRCFAAMNLHRTDVNRNIAVSVTVKLSCLACDTQHSFRESISAGIPLVVVRSDQVFPPILPGKDKKCLVVVRGRRWPSFRNIFAEFVSPNGYLPTGSVVLVGSVTHLGARGLDRFRWGLGRLLVLSGCQGGTRG